MPPLSAPAAAAASISAPADSEPEFLKLKSQEGQSLFLNGLLSCSQVDATLIVGLAEDADLLNSKLVGAKRGGISISVAGASSASVKLEEHPIKLESRNKFANKAAAAAIAAAKPVTCPSPPVLLCLFDSLRIVLTLPFFFSGCSSQQGETWSWQASACF